MKITIIFLLVTISSFSQSSPIEDISWSERETGGGKYKSITRIGTIENQFFIIKQNWKKSYIETSNSNSAELVSEYQLNLKYEDNQLNLISSFILNDEIIFITSFQDFNSNTEHYFFSKYLGEGEISKPQIIGKTNYTNPMRIAFTPKARKGIMTHLTNLKLSFSPDKKHLVLMFAGKVDGEITEYWNVKKYDFLLNELWSYKMSLQETETYIQNMEVSNDGTVYALGMTDMSPTYFYTDINNPSLSSKKSFFSSNSLSLIKIDGEKKEHKISAISLDENVKVHSISLKVLENNIVLYGLSTSIGDKNLNGAFLSFMNFDCEEISSNFTSFTDKFAGNTIGPKSPKNLKDYTSCQLLEKKNGDIILTTSQYKLVNLEGNNYYTFYDQIIISVNQSGKTNWKKLIKFKNVNRDSYSASSTIISNNKVYILLNQYKKDIINEEGGKGYCASYISIDNSGFIENKILYDFPEDIYKEFIPEFSGLINEEKILLIFSGKSLKEIRGIGRL